MPDCDCLVAETTLLWFLGSYHSCRSLGEELLDDGHLAV